MDPITAIGLASGIITFLDFSWAIVTGVKELHESGARTTKENDRIGKIINDLKDYARDIEAGGPGASKHDMALRELATDCGKLCKELVAILERLKSKKNSKWQNLKTVLASMRKAGEVAAIEARLGEYRAEMNLRLLSLLSDQQSAIKSQMDNIQNEAKLQSSASALAMGNIRDELTKLLDNLREKDEAADDSSTDDEQEPSEHQKMLFESLDDIKISLAGLHRALSSTPKETSILRHLHFECIFSRENRILDATDNTFEWIVSTNAEFEQYLEAWSGSLKELRNSQQLEERVASTGNTTLEYDINKINKTRLRISRWLTSGDGIFHISGKAGSGKSTLMKFLCNHKRTKEYLINWSGLRTLVLASFFFWRAENQYLQLSLDGLFRSILFQVLGKCPDLIPQVLPEQWEAMGLPSTNKFTESSLFQPIMIKEAFDRLTEIPLQTEEYAFCFFIDGLDEYEADRFEHRAVAKSLCNWAKQTNVKICVSSRPEIEFVGTEPVHLHDLTTLDIYQFSRHMFETDEDFPLVKEIYLELVCKIVNMAEGVFLWASLVTKLLIVEVSLHSDHDILRQKLYSLPRELDDLYDKMIRPRDRDNQRLADYLFLLAISNPFRLSMNAMCLCWLDSGDTPRFPPPDYSYSDRETLERLENIRRQLQDRTNGILTLGADSSGLGGNCPFFSQRIQFFHRTAKDYLLAKRKDLEAEFPNFEAYRVHSCLRLMELAFVNPWSVAGAEDIGYYALEPILPKSLATIPVQQTLKHINFMEAIWTTHFRQSGRYLRFASRQTLFPFSVDKTSFLHIAAHFGQSDFLSHKLGTLKNSLLQTESKSAIGPRPLSVEMPNLLLSTCCGYFSPESVALLLHLGFSTSALVGLANSFTMAIEQYASVWIIFVALLAGSMPNNSVYNSRRSRLFECLLIFLKAGAETEVTILGTDRTATRSNHVTHFTTLRQLVIEAQPANIQPLLDLLPVEAGVEIGRQFLSRTSRDGREGVADPEFMAAETLARFEPLNVASTNELLTDIDILIFRVW